MPVPAAFRPEPSPYTAPVTVAKYARFLPRGGWQNPYMALLERHLAAQGLQRVGDAEFRAVWLLRHRREVTFLLFAWRPDYMYAWHRSRDTSAWLLPLQGVLSWSIAFLFALRLGLARTLGYRIVWTVHETYPPETLDRPSGTIGRRLDRVAQGLLCRACHLLIAHDESVASAARSEYAGSKASFKIVPHGSYVGVYRPGRAREEVRSSLRIPDGAFMFLCFGKVREDKGLELVLDAFRSLSREDVMLVVAGQAEHGPSAASLIRAFHEDRRVLPLLGFVPDDRVAELFGAADVVVLGRSEPWTSGSLILALSLGLPAIAARVGSHEEILGGGAAGWLFEPGDRASLAAAMAAAAGDPADARAKGLAGRQRAEALPSWTEIAERTTELLLPGSMPRPGVRVRRR